MNDGLIKVAGFEACGLLVLSTKGHVSCCLHTKKPDKSMISRLDEGSCSSAEKTQGP